MTTTPNTVDEYLAGVPPTVRAALEKLRRDIKAAAPMADEVISYHMPTYRQNGMVVSFAAFKGHCSLFVGSVLAAYRDELKSFGTATTKGTIRFQPSKPLPTVLVKKLVKARVEQNAVRRSEA